MISKIWKQFLLHKLEILRFSIVGFLSFIVDFGLLYGLTEFVGIYYLTSAGISFSVAVVFNYILSILWVFDTRKITSWKHEFLIFFIISIIGLSLNQLTMLFFTEYIHLHYTVSKVVAIVLLAGYGYLAKKFILFH